MTRGKCIPGRIKMKLCFRYTFLGLIGTLVLGCASVGAQEATGSFQRSLSVDEPIDLVVSTGAGRITIRAGQTGQVEILGRIQVRRRFGRSTEEAEELVRRFEADPPIEFSGGRVRVGHIEERAYQRNVSISYEIEVPAETAVKSDTGSGDQIVSGVTGPVQAGAGSGTVTVTDLGGSVDAHTGSGSIRAEGIGGAFKARTGSGSVSLAQNGPGDVEVSTGSGSIDLSGINGALRAHAGSGRITAEGEQNGRWDLETGSGSIRVRLPQDAGFELNAQSGSGQVYTDHPITVRGRIDRGRLSGQVRGGGPLLQVRAGSGTIRIE